MARAALTALTVQKIKPPASKTARAERYDARVPGFGVRVTAEGSRSWIFVYTSPTQKKRRRYTIGVVDFKDPDGETTLDLEQARTKANDLRRMVREGRDPVELRASAEVAVVAEARTAETRTFRAVVDLYNESAGAFNRACGDKAYDWSVLPQVQSALSCPAPAASTK